MKTDRLNGIRRILLGGAGIILTSLFTSITAQTIRGTVTEATTGEPIIGATVVLKETTFGTVTDMVIMY